MDHGITAVYSNRDIEGNTFRETRYCPTHNAHAVYGQMGGVYVFRHNEVRNMNCDSHGFEVTYSTREYEISNNRHIAENGINLYTLIYLRGGTGVIYDNVVSTEGSGNWTYGVVLTESRITTIRGNPARPELHGGVGASTCCPSEEGHPCTDQIGRGQSTGTSPNQTQADDPLYICNNFPVAVQAYGGSGCTGNINDFIQEGRDYITGAAKPTYTGYPYPHPLTGQACLENCGGDSVPPAAPTNLQVVPLNR